MTAKLSETWVEANWPAPSWVRAGYTTRIGGISQPPYDGLNLGTHVGDDPAAAASNRQQLQHLLELDTPPYWLNQVRGRRVIEFGEANCDADGCVSHRPGQVCAIMTADCLPILLCHATQPWVAAVHGGWRSLAADIIATAVAQAPQPHSEILAWLGPAISQANYQVDQPVVDAFVHTLPKAESAICASSQPHHWQLDLSAIATLQLNQLGISQIYRAERCTFEETQHFFSHRRQAPTGRQASLIWLTD